MPKTAPRRTPRAKTRLPRLLRFIFWGMFLGLLLVIADLAVFALLPDVAGLARNNPSKTAFMRHREQEAARLGVRLNIRQEWVGLKAISPALVLAVTISEDDKFWRHEGFDLEAMQDALERDLAAGELKAGGSTISQQLAKNLYLSPSKNLLRKLEEAILTWRLERELSKRRILELYLNTAEWGEGIFGIQAAASHYFAKDAQALTREEAARLAAVLPNPRRWSPTGESRYVEKRARIILSRMARRERGR